jgi:hypothetical protein
MYVKEKTSIREITNFQAVMHNGLQILSPLGQTLPSKPSFVVAVAMVV